MRALNVAPSSFAFIAHSRLACAAASIPPRMQNAGHVIAPPALRGRLARSNYSLGVFAVTAS
jgi:hypothetical protein